eukprot:COSAG03_NODE_7115_length_961_cov_1.128770_1_plen_86_part_00
MSRARGTTIVSQGTTAADKKLGRQCAETDDQKDTSDKKSWLTDCVAHRLPQLQLLRVKIAVQQKCEQMYRQNSDLVLLRKSLNAS